MGPRESWLRCLHLHCLAVAINQSELHLPDLQSCGIRLGRVRIGIISAATREAAIPWLRGSRKFNGNVLHLIAGIICGVRGVGRVVCAREHRRAGRCWRSRLLRQSFKLADEIRVSRRIKILDKRRNAIDLVYFRVGQAERRKGRVE